MLIRRNGKVRLYLNTSPGATRKDSESVEYPKSKKYFVWSDGEVVKRTDSLRTAEETFSSESGVDGRMKIGKTNVKELV